MYQALYRTWRPLCFADVVGQPYITATLLSQVAHHKTAHAYLFAGSRGTGKTTCSKILAKAVNCLDPNMGDPCGLCPNCLAIEHGAMTDVVEIDAASNNGVDDVRQLREEALYSPAMGKTRVYIIDEAHMLSKSAFNALLKIMEEPPAHVLFILATTEAHKIPDTILSRVQRFDFARVSQKDIAGRISHIAKEEQMELTQEAADLISAIADGGLRDAISTLDQCGAMGGVVDEERVRLVAGLADDRLVTALVDHLLDQDLGGVLTDVSQLHSLSVDFKQLAQRLLTVFRNLMVVKSVKKTDTLVICTKAEMETLKLQAKKASLAYLLYGMDVLQELYRRIGSDRSAKALFELSMLKLASPNLSDEPGALAARLGNLEKGIVRAGTKKKKDEASTDYPADPSTDSPGEGFYAPESPPAEETGQPPPSPKETLQVEGLLTQWPGILEILKRKNPPLYATLEGSVAYLKGDLVLIDAENTVFLDLMRASEATKESLRAAIEQETGKAHRLGPVKKGAKIEMQTKPLDALRKAAKETGVELTEQ